MGSSRKNLSAMSDEIVYHIMQGFILEENQPWAFIGNEWYV
jgi:hypothetical protein